eukprot:CAMPEP_0118964152 /NCGR_PEP_ID=MMETSP1173-20130426/1897_2 /TAXON_ID=1034831 /ORGANISM="Rhizochromulina marina cf, Strain CCMP1243" /LENGTH=51 /DNA_ID=CAMNT_0006912579 /DNA_START=212 /DNA_END=364 /DNA_ORIENTATION=-
MSAMARGASGSTAASAVPPGAPQDGSRELSLNRATPAPGQPERARASLVPG